MKRSSLFAVTLLSLVVPTTTLAAQVIDLTVHDVGLAIGDKPEMTGLRINYRDRHLREITGVNLTLWSPYEPATGTVNGLALGVPLTGAEKINGALIGIFGGEPTDRSRELASAASAWARVERCAVSCSAASVSALEAG